MAYEPSFSPDGQSVVFETHKMDVKSNGIITQYKIDGTGSFQPLTSPEEDCRPPNWSPIGNLILFQKFSERQWDIWVMDRNGHNQRKVTHGAGDKTDGSFSPDGKWIVYSSNERGIENANLFIISIFGGGSIRVSDSDGYDGAPSWSPDETWILFESCFCDPDDSSGTSLWNIKVPEYEKNNS